MLTLILFRKNPRADNIISFDFEDIADKCLSYTGRFPITLSDNLVMWVSRSTYSTFYDSLTAIYPDLDIRTSNYMLLYILAASNRTDNF